MISAERMAELFVSVADTLVHDFDLIDFLHSLAEWSVDLTGAEAAGILLVDENGHLQFMAASNREASLLEIFQAERGQGACRDAFESGERVVDLDLRRAGARWPTFAPKAVELGFGSVHALPMRVREQRIGALNLFSGPGVEYGEGDVILVQALADAATIAVIQERTIRQAETLADQLRAALLSRVVIEQAKGVVAQAEGVDVEEAFRRLRAAARHRRERLTDVCRRVVADPGARADVAELGRRLARQPR